VVIYYDDIKYYNSFSEMAVDCDLDNISYCCERFVDEDRNVYPGARYDFKVSMYLGIPGSYTRTLFQGATLTDSRKKVGNYQRSVSQTALGTGATKGIASFCRSVVEVVKSVIGLKREPTLTRKLVEATATLYAMTMETGFSREILDRAGNSSVMGRVAAKFRILFGYAGSGDKDGSFISRMRTIQDTGTTEDTPGHAADYVRGLFIEARSIAGTRHGAEYHRTQQDMTQGNAVTLRHLFVFVRLLSGSFVRDYMIGRFLKSREEIVIKSLLCREITLDSRLH
jgi:hypothetical protein